MEQRRTNSANVSEAPDRLSEHYIETQISLVERPLRSLKADDAFAVLDSYGDIGAAPDAPEGLFYRDMRHLSRLRLWIEGQRPLLLGSVIQDDNAALSVDLTNPDIHGERNDVSIARDLIAIDRTKFLWMSSCYERIGLINFDNKKRRIRIDLTFSADFKDLFEVRGMQRARRGRAMEEVKGGAVILAYQGLDGVRRRTALRFEPAPQRLEVDRASFDVLLEPEGHQSLLMTTSCDDSSFKNIPVYPPPGAPPRGFAMAYRATRRALRVARNSAAVVTASNAAFNELVARSTADLCMLMTPGELGLYPYAGIPWYSTMFGRDGIITAMLLLWSDPTVARGVLRRLAALQASTFDAASDAQPGKILHEQRHGEMANLGEVPFRLYYGSADATPLFVMLAGQYFERTGDLQTIEGIWPNIEAALKWCDAIGDRDGDGFIEYYRETENGLANQGWKDSHDSIFHDDGAIATGPIALVEVQAYAYGAKRAAGKIAHALGLRDRADALGEEADRLRARFEEAFWCEELGTYALALDGSKRQCKIRTSNAGHALFTGIADPTRAAKVAASLMSEAGFSGWGIRTLSKGEPRYNPMSYHNGSVWPHDNAIVALGFARYGLKEEACKVFEAIFGAANYQDQRRLPELYCGFLRRRRRRPTAYPVACSPQAWAAAAPFALLQACLGLQLPATDNEIRLVNPVLPAFLDEVFIRGLRLGTSNIDLLVHRSGRDVTVSVLDRRPGSSAHIVLTKTK